MDLHIHVHQGERLPDWPAAAVAGLGAGAVLMVLELFWSALVTGGSPWTTSHLIAAIVMGPDTLQSTDFNVMIVAVALVAHYVLGALFGLLLAAIIAPLHLDSTVGLVSAGAVFGACLYLLNFYGMAHFLPWFVEWRGAATLITHVIFGVAAALFYWKLNRYGADRPS